MGDIVVPRLLPLKGPRGVISKPWISRELQSLSRAKPNMWSSARVARRRWRIGKGRPMMAASSSS